MDVQGQNLYVLTIDWVIIKKMQAERTPGSHSFFFEKQDSMFPMQ